MKFRAPHQTLYRKGSAEYQNHVKEEQHRIARHTENEAGRALTSAERAALDEAVANAISRSARR